MSSEIFVRRVERIHLGDGKYIPARAIEMEFLGGGEEESDDEMETLAYLRFSVDGNEYLQLSRLGMVDTVPGEAQEDNTTRLTFRTDVDLLDEAEETFREEWEESLDDSDEEPTVWNDLDYWELHSIDS